MINIIAVDDEQDAKVLFDHFFRKEVEGGRVSMRFVHTARECLELLARGAANGENRNALVITDINMPDMDGIKLTETINKKFPSVKVFLVSAYDARSQIGQIQHLNIAEYISKPVDFGALKERIFELDHN